MWTVDSGQWTVDCGLWTVDCGVRGAKAPRSEGTLFRAAIGRASGRVTAIRTWQAQHYPQTPNFLTVHSPQTTDHSQCEPPFLYHFQNAEGEEKPNAFAISFWVFPCESICSVRLRRTWSMQLLMVLPVDFLKKCVRWYLL